MVPSPVSMPKLVEVVQWHKYRTADPARAWLLELLKASIGD
jgi:LysR family nod box-dependent transcriptional activator